MCRWLTVLVLLGPTVMNGWGSGGAAELKRNLQIHAFWQLFAKSSDLPEGIRESVIRAGEGNPGTCRELFEAGASRFPDKAGWLHYEQGAALSGLGSQEAAMTAFRQALELRKGLRISFAYFALADLHERRGEFEEAWKVFQELTADPEALAIHLVETAGFAQRHSKGDAQQWFERAMEKYEKEGLTGLGQATAAAHFQRAAAMASELKLEQRCEALFREGMRQHPESAGWLQFELALALEGFGHLEKALSTFRAAKENPSGLRGPGYAGVGEAKVLEKLGKTAEAAQIFSSLLKGDAVLPYFSAEAAGFEARQGRPQRALELYLDAFRSAREEKEQVSVGNILLEGIGSLPRLKDLAEWFRSRTETLPATEKQRIRRALATTFGNHAWKLLNDGAFAEAGTSAEMALVIYAPDVLRWVEGNRAHAYLFQGRIQEAREIHQRYRDQKLELDALDWKKAAWQDFQTFREKGLVTPKVEEKIRELETLLGIRQSQ